MDIRQVFFKFLIVLCANATLLHLRILHNWSIDKLKNSLIIMNGCADRDTSVHVSTNRNNSQGYDMSTQQSPAALQSTVDREKVYTWIIELSNPETRENALLELSKKREVVPDLAPMLWHSFGTTASLLQEIINIYPAINPATLTAYQSNRVCNALALLQCVASHPETRSAFLQVRLFYDL